ncbi:MAG: flagellar motor switch phosphatase FliY [Negativicutes bacterium]|nr:flagellar motor switch phosphatase FliY [Negativicutes bacterium]
MSDGFLTQEEIDALLRGEPISSPDETGDALSDIEVDALGEIGNISMGSAATTLSILLARRVSITTPRVICTTLNNIKHEFPLPYLVIEVGYNQGIVGSNMLAIRERDALIIADLMMGGDGSNPAPALDELAASAVTEAMNQMMGSVATAMSTIFKKKVDITPPISSRIDFASDAVVTNMVAGDEPIARVSFRMEVEDLIDSEIMQILPLSVAKEMVNSLLGAVQPPAPPPSKTTPPPPAVQQPMYREPVSAYSQPLAAAQQTAVNRAAPAPNVTVQPVQFAPLKPAALTAADTNISLIMDVPLQVTVELGRTRKLIRDILELAPGSIVELDKLAGEPVDILVNGKLIAKGEVVVIDENFGVRITEILNPIDRLNNLQ